MDTSLITALIRLTVEKGNPVRDATATSRPVELKGKIIAAGGLDVVDTVAADFEDGWGGPRVDLTRDAYMTVWVETDKNETATMVWGGTVAEALTLIAETEQVTVKF